MWADLLVLMGLRFVIVRGQSLMRVILVSRCGVVRGLEYKYRVANILVYGLPVVGLNYVGDVVMDESAFIGGLRGCCCWVGGFLAGLGLWCGMV